MLGSQQQGEDGRLRTCLALLVCKPGVLLYFLRGDDGTRDVPGLPRLTITGNAWVHNNLIRSSVFGQGCLAFSRPQPSYHGLVVGKIVSASLLPAAAPSVAVQRGASPSSTTHLPTGALEILILPKIFMLFSTPPIQEPTPAACVRPEEVFSRRLAPSHRVTIECVSQWTC